MLRGGRFQEPASVRRHSPIDQNSQKEPKTKAERAFNAFSLSAIGLEMGVAVGIGFFVGDWLDDELGTYPYMTLFWLFAGIAAAFLALWRAAKKAKPSSGESNE